MATVGQDIFRPTKFGGKYTVTLIPGTPKIHDDDMIDRHLNVV